MSGGEIIIARSLWFFCGIVYGWASRQNEINRLREQVVADKALRDLERVLNA